jgi:YgiT-type zinc finger domain-containing protein
MERKTSPFHADRKGYHLIFDMIPAWVCTQCGEVYFEEAEVSKIQETLRTVDKQAQRLLVST